MPTDSRVGEEGGREGSSCWCRSFTVRFGVYEWVAGEDGRGEGDRQGKCAFICRLVSDSGTISNTRGKLISTFMCKTQIDNEKHTATFLAGTTLHEIHASLASSNPQLAIPNIGSISDQTIAGLISTASHGSGVTFPVLSAHVKSLLLALPLPGTPLVRVSQNQDEELFKASLCGLGTTGLILEVEFEVEDAFRLRETKEGKAIEEVLESLDEIEKSAEHVRVWWYPDGKGAVVGRANRTYDVRFLFSFLLVLFDC